MTNREVNQIKLELNKSPLDQHDMEMLHAISKAVIDNNADIGFGFDGDGDRWFTDEYGDRSYMWDYM